MDIDSLIRLAAALGAVLGLVLLAAWAMRRFGLGGLAVAASGPAKRLSVVEARPLDARRQLLLLRRDDVEHLVILSAAGETVIETGIPARREDAL
ncbi:MAG: flagellar biosynthetic protein FliO [Alphaproteobacteria bacterium]|jgi:flagellar protein FliO/FliZ